MPTCDWIDKKVSSNYQEIAPGAAECFEVVDFTLSEFSAMKRLIFFAFELSIWSVTTSYITD